MDDSPGVPHIIFIICIMLQRNTIFSFYGKITENQKLVEQMITSKTLSLYSTAHYISHCIINTKRCYGPVTVVTNPGHGDDSRK